MKLYFSPRTRITSGFTLVEMTVIAPIVILMIGAFIGLIVNLTGEIMSSRGANIITYNLQDALNRIEDDVKLSTTYLASTNIALDATLQGAGGTPGGGSTTPFTNVDMSSSGGSTASLILNALTTDRNPMSDATRLIYLRNQPNACTASDANFSEFSKNRPMTHNVVYFISNATLWRRVVMPPDYNDTAARCGSRAPWQQPSCMEGYDAATLPFCKTSDEKLLEGVTPGDFSVRYFTQASATTPTELAVTSSLSNAERGSVLQSTPTVEVTLTSRRNIAGRDVQRSGTLRATRLDTNATSIASITAPSTVPAAPVPTGTVSDGSNVTFTWPQVASATSYDAQYRINNGTWQALTTNIPNNNRSFVVTAGGHSDKVDVRVRANNVKGSSAFATATTTIPLWAPLVLQRGWTDYLPGGYSPASYTKTKAGLVLLRGLIEKPITPSTPAPTSTEVIATLPPKYRPAGGILIFGNSTNTGMGRMDVYTGGDIQYLFGGNSWFSLETVRFLAADAPVTRVTPTLQNGWTNYGNWHAPASYAQDSTGRVSIQGLIRYGTIADGTVIFNLPSALNPPLRQHMASESNGPAHINIDHTKNAVTTGGNGNSASHYGINASYLPASAPATWTNMPLANGWSNYGGIFTTAQYTKASDGVVHLRGLVTAGALNSVVGTLPPGFRPKHRILYTTANTNQHSRIDITPDGTVFTYATTNAWLSLDNILFVPEQ